MKNKSCAIIVTLLLLLTCCCISCCGGSIWFISEAYKTEDRIDADFEFPDEVYDGEDFEWTLEFTNSSDNDIEISSISIPQSFLDGVKIKNTDPDYSEREENTYTEEIDYYFEDFVIGANSTEIITFESKALDTGNFSGTFTIYTGRLYNQMEQYAEVTIESGYDYDYDYDYE